MTTPRIALGESDPAQRYLLASALIDAGYDVFDVEDGVALLELFGESGWTPDAVIVDADLPRLSGLDVLAELRDATRPVPVILLAAEPIRDLRLRARRLGAFAVLERPVGAELVVEVARRATRGPLVVPHHLAVGSSGPDRRSVTSAEAEMGQFEHR